jgi:hypothetical protein
VRRKQRIRFIMFRVRGILGLDARLMRKPLTSLKVCSFFKSLQFKSWIYNAFPTWVTFLFSLLIGLPGVLFVLPDSYVDPEYKDYGGKTLYFFLRVLLICFCLGLI